jgi:hypothetical protein
MQRKRFLLRSGIDCYRHLRIIERVMSKAIDEVNESQRRELRKLKADLGPIVLAALVLVLFAPLAVPASAQTPQPLYAAGQFPAGQAYSEQDIPSLVGQTFSSHAYLVGKFAYLGVNRNGVSVFSTFSSGAEGISFGRALVGVTFFHNAPPGLQQGKLISPTAEEPLVIRRVSRSADGRYLLVETECWSLPTSESNNP